MLQPEQFSQLLRLLQQIADKPSTITGMQDWPMLMVLCSMFGGVMLLMIGGGIGYILNKIETDRKENKEEHNRIWQAYEDCQTECCPRLGGRRANDQPQSTAGH